MEFYKYQGAGNDFILIDNRDAGISLTTSEIAAMCKRRLGIGADGLMLLQRAEGYDFRMVYYNADGNESSMCGNGGRCITAFAKELGIITDAARFIAIDGAHIATIHADGNIRLEMNDVKEVNFKENTAVLNTGSPHYVLWVDDIIGTDVGAEGRKIRNSAPYVQAGINVNFTKRLGESKLFVRTYERGVEEETLSCGTGVTAAAIASTQNETGLFSIDVETLGGHLTVAFKKDSATSATGVLLTGPAELVFKGNL